MGRIPKEETFTKVSRGVSPNDHQAQNLASDNLILTGGIVELSSQKKDKISNPFNERSSKGESEEGSDHAENPLNHEAAFK